MASARGERSAYHATGYQMIRSVDIQHYKCFERLQVEHCSRLNVIVGDNGSGKTALLEAIFLPLSTGTEMSMRHRTQRGHDTSISGPRRQIEDALWGELFHDYNDKVPIVLLLSGDAPEARSLVISRGPTDYLIPLTGTEEADFRTSGSVNFLWKNAHGREFPVSPEILPEGLKLPDTGEDMPDFFYFAAGQTVRSIENASRFSVLSKENRQHQFVEMLSKEYTWIKDINIEVSAGSPVLYATIKGTADKIPLPNISGGVNRMISILLALASRPHSVVCVDEIENGIYHKHHSAFWKALLNFMREFDSQLFVSTHSHECLEALAEAAGEDLEDISLWRLERGDKEPALRQFHGTTFRAGVETGGELR